MKPAKPSAPKAAGKEKVYKNVMNPLSWQAVRERLAMPGHTVIKRFHSPSQINFMIAGEGMIYFVAGGDFTLKSIVKIDPWRKRK